MTIESVDFLYLSLPEVRDIGDGSQDALLVRIEADGFTGWGECEASPLVSIASWICPMSHSACKPLSASVIGQTVDGPEDIARISRIVRANSFDIAQTDHTLSGIDIALWDLLGKKRGEPVWRLLGYTRAYPKTPYASQLFGDSPPETFAKALQCREQGYRAAKFGWGPYGAGDPADDADHVAAARDGLGPDGALLIDAGTIWVDDVAKGLPRLDALKKHRVLFLEEPFVSGALASYAALAARSEPVLLAGGEGAHNFYMAQHMIDYAGIKFVQIDTGRIGGITTAKQVADYAAGKGVTYINHTFTTHLALSASLQPFAGLEASALCEYPVEASPLGYNLVTPRIERNAEGLIEIPDAPGLGVEPDLDVVRKYLVNVAIDVAGQTLYRTPDAASLQLAG
jgi:L-alanine-DL-glutamate epimerase-like enolase superfamily enzyme